MNKIYLILILPFTFLSCRSQELVNLKSINKELKNVVEKDNKLKNINEDNIEARERALFEIIKLRKELFSKVNLKNSKFKLIETTLFNKYYNGIIFTDNNDIFIFHKKDDKATFEQTNLDNYKTSNPNDISLYIFKKLKDGKLNELITLSDKSKNHHGDVLIITNVNEKVSSTIMNTFFVQDKNGKILYW